MPILEMKVKRPKVKRPFVRLLGYVRLAVGEEGVSNYLGRLTSGDLI
jgi:hypothetical protein